MPGSIAFDEIESSDHPEKLSTAFSQGSLMIEVTMDHFSSLTRSISQPVLTISPWTTIRSLMESSAIGLWLMETEIGHRERIIRSLKFRCEGLLQQKKFARTAGEDTDYEQVNQRYTEVLFESESFGLELYRDKEGKIKRLRKQIPSNTTLISNYLNLETEYRLFSAIAHAHPWALHALSFKNADIPNRLLLEKDLSIEAIQYIGVLVFSICKAPILQKCRLFGWPDKGFNELFDDTQSNFSDTVKRAIELSNKTT
jgi:hypothetical protein